MGNTTIVHQDTEYEVLEGLGMPLSLRGLSWRAKHGL